MPELEHFCRGRGSPERYVRGRIAVAPLIPGLLFSLPDLVSSGIPWPVVRRSVGQGGLSSHNSSRHPNIFLSERKVDAAADYALIGALLGMQHISYLSSWILTWRIRRHIRPRRNAGCSSNRRDLWSL